MISTELPKHYFHIQGMKLVAQKMDDHVQRAAKLYIHIQEHYMHQWSPTFSFLAVPFQLRWLVLLMIGEESEERKLYQTFKAIFSEFHATQR